MNKPSAPLTPGSPAFRAALSAIQEARATFGVEAARGLWRDLGLPALHHVDGLAPEPPRVRLDRLVDGFLTDRVIQAEGGKRLGATALWEGFRAWCASCRAETGSQAAFGRCLSALGLAKVMIRGRLFYCGVCFR